MKGQSALEYLIVVGLALAIITPIFYYSLTYSSDTIITGQATQAVETIAKAVDYVYILGPNSKTYVWVQIPNSVNETSVVDRTVLIRVSTSAGITDIFANTRANVTGSLPSLEGRYYLIINRTDSGNVTISQP